MLVTHPQIVKEYTHCFCLVRCGDYYDDRSDKQLNYDDDDDDEMKEE